MSEKTGCGAVSWLFAALAVAVVSAGCSEEFKASSGTNSGGDAGQDPSAGDAAGAGAQSGSDGSVGASDSGGAAGDGSSGTSAEASGGVFEGTGGGEGGRGGTSGRVGLGGRGGTFGTGGRNNSMGGSSGAVAVGGKGGTGFGSNGGGPATSGMGGTGGGEVVGTHPCAGLCDSPIVFSGPSYTSGVLGSGPTCHETTYGFVKVVPSNLESRKLRVNGEEFVNSLGVLPAKRLGGYCFQISAGAPDYTSFAVY